MLVTAGFQIPAYVVLMQISLLTFLPHLSETIAKYSNSKLHVRNLTGQNFILSMIISMKLNLS